jgi:hypothetical protein
MSIAGFEGRCGMVVCGGCLEVSWIGLDWRFGWRLK